MYVLLDAASKLQDTDQDTYQTPRDELVDSLNEQLSYLKAVIATRDEELRPKDHIIAALTERIPELEPPREPRESPTEAFDEPGKGDDVPLQEERRSWWRKLVGG